MSRYIARGGSPNSLREEEMMRVSNMGSRSTIFTDGPRDQAQTSGPGRSRSTPKRSSTPGVPRLPSKNRFNSTTSIDGPQRASTGEKRVSSPSHISATYRDSPRTRTPPAKQEYRARCVPEDDADVIERDHVGVQHKTPSVSTSYSQTAHYRPKQIQRTPSAVYDRKDSVFSDQMELSPTIAIGGMSFDPEQYQQHLHEIQQQANEYTRLQEGMMMLLPNTDGDHGLHQAVIHNRPTMMVRLLELMQQYPQLKTCIDDQNTLFQTPLILTAHLSLTNMMRMLLQSGANPLLQDHKGNTVLHVACKQSNTKCLDELLTHLSTSALLKIAEIRNYEGKSCAHIAIESGSTEALLKLRGAGVNMNMEDYHSGKTPLHIAVEKGSFQLAQLLVQSCGCDVNQATYSGCTPLHIAAGRGQLEIVAYLISLGADPYAETGEGDTPCDFASTEIVGQFLDRVTCY